MERRAVQSVLGLLAQVIVLALVNLVVGRLSLLLAVAPEVAAPIFPPAGIALAALLLYGQRLAPGVFIGAFLLELQTLPGDSLVLLSTSAGIAAGSTAQAMLGAWLIRRVVGFPTPLDRERDVAGFLLLGGPVSCLAAPSVAVVCLVGAGMVGAGDMAFT
ncbi:MAG: MASE1 domain-containing protein, partial [Phycisphaerae bacterium]|nr:MASE1 domain-containing protein [Phycisphaerae bacterium]